MELGKVGWGEPHQGGAEVGVSAALPAALHRVAGPAALQEYQHLPLRQPGRVVVVRLRGFDPNK